MNRTKFIRLTIAATLTLTALTARAADPPATERPLTLAVDGASKYVIYVDTTAPSNVVHAAQELQRAIRIASGVELSITNAPTSPMICVGNGVGATAAGLSGDALAYENYLILTRYPNLYIVGRDTPDGEQTAWSGFSRGSLYGVYAFLEEAMGVRWLMPGEIGEVIPKHDRLVVGPLNLEDGPDFEYRRLELGGPPVVREWVIRQRLSRSLGYGSWPVARVMDIGHAWNELMPEELREKHPEWASEANKAPANYKFCTRNPEAVRALARNAIRHLDAHPEQYMVRISPSDGQYFCRCERCLPYVERDPHGQFSYTYNILSFYNDVARIIARERPGKMVGGFVYGADTYPPERTIDLEPNLFLCWAPLNHYGLGLYMPKFDKEFEQVAAAWRQLTDNLGYLNYLHWHRSFGGAPLAPSLSLLKRDVPLLKQLGYKGVYQATHRTWSYGGPNNYIQAKLMWDADTDVDALYDEWLTTAYGGGAEAMRTLYARLDEAYRKHKVAAEATYVGRDNYEVTADKIESIYLPLLDTIETLYTEALAAAQGEQERRRLRLFGAQMVVFHYHLRSAGYLDNPEDSMFYRTDEAYEAFAKQPAPDLPGFPWVMTLRAQPLPPKPEPITAIERRTLAILKTASEAAPRIDGRIEKGEWANYALATEFRSVGGLGEAQPGTVGLVTYDEENLYVAFECEEPLIKQVKTQSYPLDDPRVWHEETVELLLTVGANPYDIRHFTVTPSNNRWDGIRTDYGFNPTWKSAVSKGEDQWTVEMAIPFAALGVDTLDGKTIRANLTRSRVLGEKRQNSTWNAVTRGFLEPVDMGVWQCR